MSASDNALAGALTGTATRAICQPLDVLKIRLQLQSEDSSRAKYKSIRHALCCILKEEGVFAYWKGHVPGQYLSILYGSINIGIYQTLWSSSYLKSQTRSSDKFQLMLSDVLVGTLSAMPATVISYPFDIIRTRLIGQSPTLLCTKTKQSSKYTGISSAMKEITSKEGCRAVYKGLSVAIFTIPMYSGLSLCIYNVTTPYVLPHVTKIDSIRIPFLSDTTVGILGGLSGIITKTIIYPLDTVKKRLQIQGFSEGRQGMGITPRYEGFCNCLTTVYRMEGLYKGLYKGWVPGIIKAFVSKGVYFMILERSLYLIDHLHNL